MPNKFANEWLGINPGRLRDSIQIQVATETQDTFGTPIPSWSTVATVKASIIPLVGQELFSERQIHSEVTHRIMARYLAGVDTKQRVLLGERAFDILSARNVEERGLLLEIMAKERA